MWYARCSVSMPGPVPMLTTHCTTGGSTFLTVVRFSRCFMLWRPKGCMIQFNQTLKFLPSFSSLGKKTWDTVNVIIAHLKEKACQNSFFLIVINFEASLLTLLSQGLQLVFCFIFLSQTLKLEFKHEIFVNFQNLQFTVKQNLTEN